MKKTTTLCIIVLFFLQAFVISTAIHTDKERHSETIVFSEPSIITSELTSTIHIESTNQYAPQTGAAFRPLLQKTFYYPFGTTIEHIDVTFSNPKTFQISKPLATKPYPKNTIEQSTSIIQDEVDTDFYETFFYTLDTGIKDHEHIVYLNIYISPVAYSENTKSITLFEQSQLEIKTMEPKKETQFVNEFDLVIITSENFESETKDLVDHKNNLGIKTMTKLVEDIYQEYTGRDDVEKIKYFIKDAIEQYGISYVLLIGGRNGGIFKEEWYVPVRYVNVDDGWETTYISDLYYADIYNETGEFAHWDTNGNGKIGEWADGRKDILGLYPDVYLGRLPCRNTYELQLMIDKIITYETANKESWFYNMVVVGGDSATGDEYYEGEEENKQALLYMQEFNGIHCWTSDGTLTGPQDVINAVTPGCGFLFFDGHGNPASWSNHPPDDAETWITGLTIFDMPQLKNKDKYPICVIGACHNGQFNVSLLNLIKDLIEYGPSQYFFSPPFKFYHMEWVPECWAWRLACTKDGGSIATLAYTGLDWFATGDYDNDGIPDCTQYLSGFTNTHFFKNYGINNIHILGETHTQTLIDYLNTHPPMNQVHDCKTVQEFVLLGDPTLQMEATI